MNKNNQWYMNEVYALAEGLYQRAVENGEFLKIAAILAVALVYELDIDDAPDWVRIVHNMELDDEGRPVDLPAVLDVALARLKDGE